MVKLVGENELRASSEGLSVLAPDGVVVRSFASTSAFDAFVQMRNSASLKRDRAPMKNMSEMGRADKFGQVMSHKNPSVW